MDIDLSGIKDALDNAYYLLNNELESVCDDNLRREYEIAISKIEVAIRDINNRDNLNLKN